MTKFLGMPYPVINHARGYFHVQQGTDQIKSDLLALLLTNPGERIMLPNFGTGLRDFLFEPNDAVVATEVRQRIIEQIRLWEHRVVIENITVTVAPEADEISPLQEPEDAQHILLIRIEFIDPDNIQEIQELVLEVPLGVGGVTT